MDILHKHLTKLKEDNLELKAELNRVNAVNAKLIAGLKEIYEIASISDGVGFYATLAAQTLKGEGIV